MPVFSRLLPTLVSAYALQTVLAAVFVPLHEDRFYDLSGALGWLSTSFLSLYYTALKARFVEGTISSLPHITSFAPRQLLLSAAVGIWSARLGTFLGIRAIKAGGDSRFDKIKHQPSRFLFFWGGQATWIALVGLPIWLVNTLPTQYNPPLGVRDYAAFGLFLGSFLFEVVADRQKTKWREAREKKVHDEKFITGGLWGISRHPNYVGEVGIWAGIYVLSIANLQTPYFPQGTVALAAISPIFTWYLLRKVSGVPPLERVGNKKFSTDPKWAEYKRTVPVFFPWGGYE